MARETIEEEPTVIEEPTIVEGKVIYEQDLRAASHRNGWASHMVEPEVGGPTEPGDPLEDDHEHHLPERPPAMRLAIGITYLAAGTILVYAGIVVLKDWRQQGKKPKENET
jgi:hypothetical protein